jgi:hypothetical protein
VKKEGEANVIKNQEMRKRQMVVAGKRITFAEAEDEDIFFWADRTWKERLQETERLRRKIWTHRLGEYPKRMQATGGFIKWALVAESQTYQSFDCK